MKVANSKIVKTISKHGGELVSYLSKNSPTILTGCAVAGAVTAVVLAVKATKPALEHIREEKKEHLNRLIVTDGDQGVSEEEKEMMIEEVPLKPLEVIQATWRDYIPTGIALAGTTACIIGAHSVDAKRLAAMTALYQISETTLKDYKSEAQKLLGKKKAEELKDSVAERQLDRHPMTEAGTVVTGRGETLCYEPLTGRYFRSDINAIKAAINDLNARMVGGDERISENEFFYELGLDGIKYGDDVGWNVDARIEPDFTSSLRSDGTPVLVVGHRNRPYAWFQDC